MKYWSAKIFGLTILSMYSSEMLFYVSSVNVYRGPFMILNYLGA